MNIFTLFYWGFAYTAGVAGLTLMTLHYMRTGETRESLVFHASFLLLIVLLGAEHLTRQSSTFLKNAVELASLGGALLLCYTLPVLVLSVTHSPTAHRVRRTLQTSIVLALLAIVFAGVAGYRQAMKPVVHGMLLFSIGYSMLVLYRGRLRERFHGRYRSISRMIAAVCLGFVPLFAAMDMFGIGERYLGLRLPALPVFYSFLNVVAMWVLVRRMAAPAAAELEVSYEQVKHYGISRREHEVLQLLIQGKSYRDIGQALHISLPTVKSHASSIYRKTGSAGKLDLLNLLAGS